MNIADVFTVSVFLHHILSHIHGNSDETILDVQLQNTFLLFFSSASSNKHKPVKVSLENKGLMVSFGPPHFILPSKPNSNTINILNNPSQNSIWNSKRFSQKVYSSMMRLQISLHLQQELHHSVALLDTGIHSQHFSIPTKKR